MNEDSKYLYSRIDDLISKSESGRAGISDFLSPEEVYAAENYIRFNAPACRYGFYGGYPEAERKILVLFPDYADIEDFDEKTVITALLIKSSGYVDLTHSSYMGAVLNCGIERQRIGDIVLTEGGAVVFTLLHTAEYLMSSEQPLTRVGRDKVSLSYADMELVGSLKREYEELSFTVASERIDCVAAEITRLSRENVKDVIERGDIRLNYGEVRDRSARVKVGDVISARGHGKYIIKEMQETRKGRLRIFALKYI